MDVIQIGANRGNDDLTKIIYENKLNLGKVILVEPLSVHHGTLKECYSDIPVIIEGVAITDIPEIKELTFYYSSKDGPNYEIASLTKEHIFKHAHLPEDIVEEKVKCMTINQLMEKYGFKHLDLLFIDAEGLDERIIQSIDFKKYQIKEIIYENLHIWNNDHLIHFLKRKNYSTTKGWGKNGWSNISIRQPFTLRHLVYRTKFDLLDSYKTCLLISKNVLKLTLIKLGLFKVAKKGRDFLRGKEKVL